MCTASGMIKAYEKVIRDWNIGNNAHVKMVVISDGKSSSSDPNHPVDDAAYDVRNQGVEMIALGWGGFNIDDLKDISNPILTADDPADLANNIAPLIETICG